MNEKQEQIHERLLILRAQAGDEIAFAELVERFASRLRYYLRRMLGEGADAEDALQDVWLDVVRGLPRLHDAGAFVAWLYRIAHGRVVRQLRQLRRLPASLPDEVAERVEDDADTFTAEEARQIHAALAELAPLHREVLVLRFLEGMSYDGIATVVDSPVGTVRSRLHHARRALRKRLEGRNGRE